MLKIYKKYAGLIGGILGAVALFVGVFAAAQSVINNFYGSTSVNQVGQPSGEAMLGAVSAVGRICNGSEPATQLCNVNTYEIESQTGITGATLTISGSASIDALTQGGGILATSTTAIVGTLTQADLSTYSMIEWTLNTANGTLTLPATSTLTTLLPNAGDSRTWLIHNATTTAAITATIAAGTGIDLIAYTTNDDIIDGTEYAQLTCWRQADTDLTCLTSEILHAD